MTRAARVFLIASCWLTFAFPARALDIPEPPQTYVTDGAGLLSAHSRQRLEEELRAFEERTTNQIVVATFPSLEGESLEDFSISLAEKWKVGDRDRDNGVIFLVFKEDRRMRLEVGYGLEGALPDALAGRILEEVVAPRFRSGDYDAGILQGVAAVLRAVEGEYQGAGRPVDAGRNGGGAGFLRALLIFLAALFGIDLFRYGSYQWDHRLYAERYGPWEWWVRFSILLFVLSMLYRMIFYARLSSRGGYYGSRRGFGEFSPGGDSFGGFSSGGGSFGGGGASGRW